VSGRYEYSVRSANGFLRQFAGDAGLGGVEVAAQGPGNSDGNGTALHVELVNNGATAAVVTVSDGYAGGTPATYRLRPGQRRQHTAHLQGSHGWYDLTVTSDQDSSFVRRLAGHIENGRPSVSDPAIITG